MLLQYRRAIVRITNIPIHYDRPESKLIDYLLTFGRVHTFRRTVRARSFVHRDISIGRPARGLYLIAIRHYLILSD